MNASPDVAPMIAGVIVIIAVLVGLLVTALQILIYCKIFSKAGFSWALGLLVLVPIANIIIFFYLAFADWPVQKELRSLKALQNAP